MSDKRAIYAVHHLTAPGGDVDGNLTRALRGALDAHQERYGRDPASVMVNETLIGEAREALAGLGLPTLPVISSGGCLTWECWLMVGDDDGRLPIGEGGGLAEAGGDGRRAGLLVRVEAAQGEMTPERARAMLADLPACLRLPAQAEVEQLRPFEQEATQ